MKRALHFATKLNYSRRHFLTSFSENVALADTSYSVIGVNILRLGDSLTSFNQDNSANFDGEKDVQ